MAEREGPWLRIVGLGADGIDSLSPAARRAVETATLVIGAPRQLRLVSELLRAETMSWPSPLLEALPRVFARRGEPTCVLASGDPFWYGIGASLAPRLEPGEFACYPAPSSVSLAASRLGWALQDVELVSLHGRPLHEIVRLLHPGRRVLALSWDKRTPGELAVLLSELGFGDSLLHVLEQLGTGSERVRSVPASAFELDDIDDLNLVGLEVAGRGHALPLRGVPDALFEHDGQITKQDVRALTLAALAPRPGELLWDVGAGSGSIAIEWMLAHPACRAIAIERDAGRAERIRRNAQRLGTPRLELHVAEAPLAGLPSPDAVFLGGGVRASFAHAFAALRPGGRLVANAVALETEGALHALFAQHGGSLRRISIEHAEPLGTMTGFRPQRAITQWCVHKEPR